MKIFFSLLFAISFYTSQAQIKEWKITDYENYIATSENEILVINFWATFCKPCIAEIPEMIKVSEKENVKLMLVSVDAPSVYPKKLKKFVADKKWIADIAWLNESDADYFCPKVDQQWSGSIPATLVINKKTGKRLFTEGEMSSKEFEHMLKKIMQ